MQQTWKALARVTNRLTKIFFRGSVKGSSCPSTRTKNVKKSGCPDATRLLRIYIVLPVMERGPTGRVTREERLFFPGRNGPARPSAAGRSRPPGHSSPFCVGPAECLRSPAYIRLTTCTRCKHLAFISRLLLHLFSLFSVKLLGLCAVHLGFHAEKAVVPREAFHPIIRTFLVQLRLYV